MIGTKIGQYRVLQLLGEGGMGRVLLAEHSLMKTRHAIKLLHDQLSKNEQIVQRFINEARAAGAIGHRNVVEITHIDQVEGDGPWYLVMKYLEGQTLTAFLASRKAPIEQRTIVHIIGEALNGLQAAHDRQIVHRDLKPDNLYLTMVKGDPYRTILLDFGVAQLGHDAGLVTRTGAVIGTPQYMAPEQHRGAAISDRVDIWAMGVIVYEMATGRLPYQDDQTERGSLTGAEIFHRMMTRPVVDPRYYNRALTEGFARATLMALEVDPARRSISARALALILAESTPGDGFQPSGLELLKTHADELLDGDPRLATLRLSVPSMEASSGAHALRQPPVAQQSLTPAQARPIGFGSGAQPQQVAVPIAVHPPPMSTLGAMASQSLRVARPARSRRPWLAAGIGVVAAAVIGIMVVAKQQAPTETPQVGARLASTDTAPATVHVPMPAPTLTETAAPAVRVADAGAPEASRMAPITETAADAGPIDATSLAAHPHDAGMPDSSQVVAAQASTADAGPVDAPAVAAHPQNAGIPSADSKAARPDPVATGTLKVVILPWAEVWVDGKPLGQTPVRTKVAVGPHRVRLKNDATEKTVTVTVTAAKPAVIDETW
jgi:serine/threonine protein kinase